MVSMPIVDVLMSRGVMPRHAVKAQGLLDKPHPEPFALALASLCTMRERFPDGAILGLVGERGRGKTQLSACMMAHWYGRGLGSIRYIRFAELCMRFRDAIKTGGEMRLLDEFQGGGSATKRSLLVIDEMSQRADTEHERRTLTTLIDGRYGLGEYTLLIGNDTTEELIGTKEKPGAVGDTVASRMMESGGVRVFNGPNMREANRA
jgi:DNA replication protein DnaC